VSEWIVFFSRQQAAAQICLTSFSIQYFYGIVKLLFIVGRFNSVDPLFTYVQAINGSLDRTVPEFAEFATRVRAE
jgi:hypothetical protein